MGVFDIELILVLVAFVVVWAQHWTRWAVVLPAVTGEDGQVTLLWRYVMGVGAILLVYVGWAALLPVRSVTPWRAAAFLAADVAGAAVGAVLPRVLAMQHQVRVLAGDVEQRGQALEARHPGA